MNAIACLAWLADVAMRATLVLLLVLAARLLLRRESAARQHALMLTGVLLVCGLGMASTISPGYTPWVREHDVEQWMPVQVERSGRVGSAVFYTAEAIGKSRTLAVPPPSTAALASPRAFATGLLLIWAAGSALLVLRLMTGIADIMRVRRSFHCVSERWLETLFDDCRRTVGLARRVRLIVSKRFETPMAWGPPCAMIVLPKRALGWNRSRVRVTLLHEMTHLRRHDTSTQLLARLMCALLWFHPLAWLLLRCMQSDQEHACDDRVLGAGESAPAYARHLLCLAVGTPMPTAPGWAPFPGGGGRRDVATRIRRILRTGERREAVGLRRMIVLLALGLVVEAMLILAPSASPGDPPASVQLDETSVDSVLAPIESEMREMEIPGVVVSVVKDGHVVSLRGFGLADRESELPADPRNSIFRLGSITKIITAIALVQVLEDNRIDLDTPVASFVPELVVPSRSGEPVTFRHLLTHTGGFDQLGYGRHAGAPGDMLPLGEFLRTNLVAYQAPGVISTYDTYGITLAGYLIAKISGRAYTSYVEANVFRRLGMQHSGFQLPGSSDASFAIGYAGHGEQIEAQAWEYHHTTPASSANSTAEDMSRLMLALLDEGRLAGATLVSPGSCTTMLTQQFSNHPRLAGYGLGFLTERRNDRDVAQHGGSMEGFSALLFLVPTEKLGVFIAYNREDGRLGEAVTSALMRRFFPARTELELDPPYHGPVQIDRFTGEWVNTLRCHSCRGREGFYWRASPFEIKASGERELQIGGGPARAIAPLLFQRDDGLLIAFREDGAGNITHMFIRQTVYERPDSNVDTSTPPTVPTENDGSRSARQR